MPTISVLKKRAEFVAIAKTGNSLATKGVVLQTLQRKCDSKHSDNYRIGFTVTRKVGNAVIRNRVKRRLREVAKEVMRTLAKDDYDYVIIGRKSTIERPFEALVKDLKYAMHNIH